MNIIENDEQLKDAKIMLTKFKQDKEKLLKLFPTSCFDNYYRLIHDLKSNCDYIEWSKHYLEEQIRIYENKRFHELYDKIMTSE